MTEFPSSQLSRYILPPECPDPNVYGYFYVEIGKLLWLKGGKAENSKVKIKFWGDKGAGQILRAVNASKELHGIPTAIQYEIHCPLVSFYNYLYDSTRLKFFVLDARNDKALGNVIISLPLYLRHK